MELGIKQQCFNFAYQIDKNGVIYQDIYRLVKMKKNFNNWEKNASIIVKNILSFIKILNWKIKAPKLLDQINLNEDKNDNL